MISFDRRILSPPLLRESKHVTLIDRSVFPYCSSLSAMGILFPQPLTSSSSFVFLSTILVNQVVHLAILYLHRSTLLSAWCIHWSLHTWLSRLDRYPFYAWWRSTLFRSNSIHSQQDTCQLNPFEVGRTLPCQLLHSMHTLRNRTFAKVQLSACGSTAGTLFLSREALIRSVLAWAACRLYLEVLFDSKSLSTPETLKISRSWRTLRNSDLFLHL